jgi:hypothetical protein
MSGEFDPIEIAPGIVPELRERIAKLEAEVDRLLGALNTLDARYTAVLQSHKEIPEEMRERCAAVVESRKQYFFEEAAGEIATAIRALPLMGEK